MSLGRRTTDDVHTFSVPLPESIDGIVDAVRQVLLKDAVIQVVIKDGEPITYQRRLGPDEEAAPAESSESFSELSAWDIVRQTAMEEFDPRAQGIDHVHPHSIWFWMQYLVDHEGWIGTHLLLSPKTNFWKWVGIGRRGRRLERFMGLSVERSADVPDDVFLLCGSEHRNATIAEIKFVLKGTVEEDNERAKQKSDRDGVSPRTDNQTLEAVAVAPNRLS